MRVGSCERGDDGSEKRSRRTLPTRLTSSDFLWLHISRPNLRGQGRDYHSHPASPVKLTASATRVFCEGLTFTN